MRSGQDKKPRHTPRQGQFLAFIYYYAKLNGLPPAEEDMVRYFRITPPSVHQMVVTLEKRGLIASARGSLTSPGPLIVLESSSGEHAKENGQHP